MLFNEDPEHERRWEEREREVLSRHYANKLRAEMLASAHPAQQAKQPRKASADFDLPHESDNVAPMSCDSSAP